MFPVFSIIIIISFFSKSLLSFCEKQTFHPEEMLFIVFVFQVGWMRLCFDQASPKIQKQIYIQIFTLNNPAPVHLIFSPPLTGSALVPINTFLIPSLIFCPDDFLFLQRTCVSTFSGGSDNSHV